MTLKTCITSISLQMFCKCVCSIATAELRRSKYKKKSIASSVVDGTNDR
jgi:hypothetical protein